MLKNMPGQSLQAVAGLIVTAGLMGHAVNCLADESPSRLTDKVTPPRVDAVYERPAPLLELGEKFFAPGRLDEGVEMPWGPVWQPALWVHGSYRTAYQYTDKGSVMAEWVNRLDLIGNLRLTQTERVVLAIRPLDEDGDFTGYRWHPDNDDGWLDATNLKVRTFFMEADLSELFPNREIYGNRWFDWGIALGRQPLFIQEGIMINDTIDSLGVVAQTVPLSGATNMRITALYGWNEVNRNNNREDDKASIFGVFSETDLYNATVNIDFAYIDSENGDGYYLGLSLIQNFGSLNTAFRINASYTPDEPSPIVSDGTLLFSEISWGMTGSQDLAYFNAFWAIDEYSSASRDAATGGPLGRAGILYASVGMGRYGAALNNRAYNAFGGALGYQHFFNLRQQLIAELGARKETEGDREDSYAFGLRFQQAIGQRTILQIDGFVGENARNETTSGGRVELRYKI